MNLEYQYLYRNKDEFRFKQKSYFLIQRVIYIISLSVNCKMKGLQKKKFQTNRLSYFLLLKINILFTSKAILPIWRTAAIVV